MSGDDDEMKRISITMLLAGILLASCADDLAEVKNEDEVTENITENDSEENEEKQEEASDVAASEPKFTKENFDFSQYEGAPAEWGEMVTGVKERFITDEKEIALTFDACGGAYGSDYDERLINFLREAQVPVTLFVNERWIEHNPDEFQQLAHDPLFQIENHGSLHAPLSVNGKEAWGIAGTNSPTEVFDEIMQNHETVKELTGKDMSLFRSGTAFYDEVAVEIAEALDYRVVNFDILGDAGATYKSEQVKNALLEAEPGSIALLHMNQPTSGTAAGVEKAIPLLREAGFEFVQLNDYDFE